MKNFFSRKKDDVKVLKKPKQMYVVNPKNVYQSVLDDIAIQIGELEANRLSNIEIANMIQKIYNVKYGSKPENDPEVRASRVRLLKRKYYLDTGKDLIINSLVPSILNDKDITNSKDLLELLLNDEIITRALNNSDSMIKKIGNFLKENKDDYLQKISNLLKETSGQRIKEKSDFYQDGGKKKVSRKSKKKTKAPKKKVSIKSKKKVSKKQSKKKVYRKTPAKRIKKK